MRMQYQAAVIGLLAMVSISVGATEQSVESARAAREKAKVDLIKAEEAFDRADEAYINALGGAIPVPGTPATGAQTSIGTRSRVVTFGLSGPGTHMSNPLAFRARVLVDGQPGDWTQHASGVKIVVPGEAHKLAYEVQTDKRGDMLNPEWRTVCADDLRLKDSTVIDIDIARDISCNQK